MYPASGSFICWAMYDAAIVPTSPASGTPTITLGLEIREESYSLISKAYSPLAQMAIPTNNKPSLSILMSRLRIGNKFTANLS